MTDDRNFVLPQIDDADIRKASCLLDLPESAFYGKDGTDPRQEVIKSMQPMDVAACPGSGKTTLLVAKLAILAGKWAHATRGICVLSHTNAARYQIERRLGNTTVGRCLLSYPHFVGTIHGFIDAFLAVPWLRSLGCHLKIIDNEICRRRRWSKLDSGTRMYLDKKGLAELPIRLSDTRFNLAKRTGTLPFAADTETYRKLSEACKETTKEGYHCFDDMFMWATDLIEKAPEMLTAIRDRFPVVFMDEAQDNSKEQSAILYRIFMEGDSRVVRQRFGDENQAIFDFPGAEGADKDTFPALPLKKDLPNSYRFGQMIADLADPLGVIPHRLKGHGPRCPLASGKHDGPHTVFLFGECGAPSVLDAFGRLLVETFSEEELRGGSFAAVGHVHKPPRERKRPDYPSHVGEYWPDYDPELSRPEPKPKSFLQYVLAGQRDAEAAGQTYPVVEKLAEGIVRLAGMAEVDAKLQSGRQTHLYILRRLKDRCDKLLEEYEDLLENCAEKREPLTRSEWDGTWRRVVQKIAEALAGAALSGPAACEFLDWGGGPEVSVGPSAGQRRRDNVYTFSKDGKEVQIRIGTIHSVKGQTHTATLLLETFWYGHNLAWLKKWLVGEAEGGTGCKERVQTRLKTHYVGMTRPTHLLCLTMKRSDLDQRDIAKLRARGWQVCEAL